MELTRWWILVDSRKRETFDSLYGNCVMPADL